MINRRSQRKRSGLCSDVPIALRERAFFSSRIENAPLLRYLRLLLFNRP